MWKRNIPEKKEAIALCPPSIQTTQIIVKSKKKKKPRTQNHETHGSGNKQKK